MSNIANFNNEFKIKIVNLIANGIEKFLIDKSDLVYYAFALDCEIDDQRAVFHLCLNTNEEFEKTLNEYKNGPYDDIIETEEDIEDIKYNTGDWTYQCIDTVEVLNKDEITRFFQKYYFNNFDDKFDALIQYEKDILNFFTECLIEFSKTKVFDRIPKTNDFKFYCINHDEDIDDAFTRMELFL